MHKHTPFLSHVRDSTTEVGLQTPLSMCSVQAVLLFEPNTVFYDAFSKHIHIIRGRQILAGGLECTEVRYAAGRRKWSEMENISLPPWEYQTIANETNPKSHFPCYSLTSTLDSTLRLRESAPLTNQRSLCQTWLHLSTFSFLPFWRQADESTEWD